MNNETSKSVIILLLAYLLIVFGYIFTRGFYSINAFFLIILAFSLLLFHQKLKTRLTLPISQKLLVSVFYICTVLVLAITTHLYGGIYQEKGLLFTLSQYMLIASLLLIVFSAFVTQRKPQFKIIFFTIITLAFLTRFFMILSSPYPAIDVFDALLKGSEQLLKGTNPYSFTYTKLYPDVTPNYFGYLPGALVFATPFTILLDDPRFLFVVSELVTALLIYFMLKKSLSEKLSGLAIYIPTLFLFSPRTFFMLEQAYIEPALMLFLTLIFASVVLLPRRNGLIFFLLGILITLKQTALFIPFFFFRSSGLKIKYLLWTVLPPLIIILPFIIWNPVDFYQDVIKNYLFGDLAPSRVNLQRISLSIYAFLYQQANFEQPSWITGVAVIVFFVILLTRKVKTWAEFFGLLAIWFLGLQLLIRLSFFNHYYFIGNLILLTIIATLANKPFPSAGKT